MRSPLSTAACGAAFAVLAASAVVSLACSGSDAGIDDPVSPAGGAPAASTVTGAGTAPAPIRTPTSPPPDPRPPATAPEPTATPAPSTEAAATGVAAPAESAPSERSPGAERSVDAGRGPESGRPASRTGKPGTTPTAAARTARDSPESGASGASAGQEYTWYDGDRVERVTLESGLVAQPSSRNTASDVVTRDYGQTSIVERQPRHATGDTQPVFRSSGGQLMTLPGGVLLVLDDAWEQARVDRFFADNGISTGAVERRDWAVNAFYIQTAPGLPSLNLANQLAVLEGVEISSPNWQTDVSLR